MTVPTMTAVTGSHFPTEEELPEARLFDMAMALYPENFAGSEHTHASENEAKRKVLENYDDLRDVVADEVRQRMSQYIENYVDELLMHVDDAVKMSQRYKTAGDIEDALEDVHRGLSGLHEAVLEA